MHVRASPGLCNMKQMGVLLLHSSPAELDATVVHSRVDLQQFAIGTLLTNGFPICTKASYYDLTNDTDLFLGGRKYSQKARRAVPSEFCCQNSAATG